MVLFQLVGFWSEVTTNLTQSSFVKVIVLLLCLSINIPILVPGSPLHHPLKVYFLLNLVYQHLIKFRFYDHLYRLDLLISYLQNNLVEFLFLSNLPLKIIELIWVNYMKDIDFGEIRLHLDEIRKK